MGAVSVSVRSDAVIRFQASRQGKHYARHVVNYPKNKRRDRVKDPTSLKRFSRRALNRFRLTS